MESPDLSNIKFCGEIRQSMSLLRFFGYLNLSYNGFDRKILIGTQLQSYNASSFGNPNLCGVPLKKCTTEEENLIIAKPSRENEDDDFEIIIVSWHESWISSC